MSRLSTYTAAALCAVPVIATIIPAQANQTDSTELVLQYVELEKMTHRHLEQLSLHATEPLADYIAIMLGSYIIQKKNILIELSEISDLPEDSYELLASTMHEYYTKNTAILEELVKNAHDKTRVSVKAVINHLAISYSLCKENETQEMALYADAGLLYAALNLSVGVLQSIHDNESAENAALLLNKINPQVTVISTHMAGLDREAYEKVAQTMQKDFVKMKEAILRLKKQNYYGCDNLRAYCEHLLY